MFLHFFMIKNLKFTIVAIVLVIICFTFNFCRLPKIKDADHHKIENQISFTFRASRNCLIVHSNLKPLSHPWCDGQNRDRNIIHWTSTNIKFLECHSNRFVATQTISYSSSENAFDRIVKLAIQRNCTKLCFTRDVNFTNTSPCFKPSEHENDSLVYENPNTSTMFLLSHHFGCDTNSSRTYSSEFHEPKPEYYKVCPWTEETSLETSFHGDGCNRILPAVSLANGQFHQISFHGTVFRYEYLWAIKFIHLQEEKLAKTRESLVGNKAMSDALILNMLVQKVIWESGRNIKYYYHPENMGQTTDMIHLSDNISQEIVKNISSLKCKIDNPVLCIKGWIDTSDEILQNGEAVREMTAKWVNFLQSHNYQHQLFHLDNNIPLKPCLDQAIFYTPFKSPKRGTHNFPNKEEVQNLYNDVCSTVLLPEFKINWDNIETDFKIFKNILLVVTYNSPWYTTSSYVELIYSALFEHIVFCGPEIPDVVRHPNLFKSSQMKRTFVSYQKSGRGDYYYTCASHVIKMGYNVDGIVVSGDDTLFNVHHFTSANKSALWFLPGKKILDIKATPYPYTMDAIHFTKIPYDGWEYWPGRHDLMLSIITALVKSKDSVIEKCHKQMTNITKGLWRLQTQALADFFYIPLNKFQETVKLFDFYFELKGFVEIVVPSALACITDPDFKSISMKAIWGETRDHPWSFYTASDLLKQDVVHPVKLGLLTTKDYLNTDVVSLQKFICNDVLPYFYGLRKQPSDSVY